LNGRKGKAGEIREVAEKIEQNDAGRSYEQGKRQVAARILYLGGDKCDVMP
jgi:hypothetical protein